MLHRRHACNLQHPGFASAMTSRWIIALQLAVSAWSSRKPVPVLSESRSNLLFEHAFRATRRVREPTEAGNRPRASKCGAGSFPDHAL